MTGSMQFATRFQHGASSANAQLVIPAQAGIHGPSGTCWMPAFAGMTT
jgi:hypothetical protein